MIPLFSPLTLGGQTLRNRIGVSPMCMYSAADGMPNEFHLVHLGARALGGAGLVIAEASAVTPDGRISGDDAGIWNDAQAKAWRPISRFLRDHGAVPGIQLAHAGRKAGTRRPFGPESAHPGGWPTVGPMAEPFREGMKAPRALREEELPEIVEAFRLAARRSVQADFGLIEVHAAHGYLLHQFYSPLSNRREDGYGGDFAGRTRLLREVVDAVREELGPEHALAVRLSCSDWTPGGWTIEDTVLLARELKGHGVHLVDCSSGGATPNAEIPVAPGYQVPFAAAVRRESGMPSAAVGLISEPEQANQIVAEGKADVVLLARASLRDPHWPLTAAQALGAELPVPGQYERGY